MLAVVGLESATMKLSGTTRMDLTRGRELEMDRAQQITRHPQRLLVVVASHQTLVDCNNPSRVGTVCLDASRKSINDLPFASCASAPSAWASLVQRPDRRCREPISVADTFLSGCLISEPEPIKLVGDTLQRRSRRTATLEACANNITRTRWSAAAEEMRRRELSLIIGLERASFGGGLQKGVELRGHNEAEFNDFAIAAGASSRAYLLQALNKWSPLVPGLALHCIIIKSLLLVPSGARSARKGRR